MSGIFEEKERGRFGEFVGRVERIHKRRFGAKDTRSETRHNSRWQPAGHTIAHSQENNQIYIGLSVVEDQCNMLAMARPAGTTLRKIIGLQAAIRFEMITRTCEAVFNPTSMIRLSCFEPPNALPQSVLNNDLVGPVTP